MPDKPINEYDFFKEIIERKKNSGCSACRQEGYMLEAQVKDMMRERMEKYASTKDASDCGGGCKGEKSDV